MGLLELTVRTIHAKAEEICKKAESCKNGKTKIRCNGKYRKAFVKLDLILQPVKCALFHGNHSIESHKS